jgi:WhiB family transcriptional regulator, redox-sensing transcriptional regulator
LPVNDAVARWLMTPDAPEVPLTFEELLGRPSWQAKAACKGQPAEEWVNVSSRGYGAQKTLCRTCPVQGRCLQYALERPELLGCWGGTSEAERRELRRAVA